jgi:hypothetical protein
MKTSTHAIFITTILTGHMFPIVALQTHNASYTTSGSTSSISTGSTSSASMGVKSSIMRNIHKPIDAAAKTIASASSSSSTSATTAALQEQISSLLSNSLDTTVWSVKVTTEKLILYNLTQNGIPCYNWCFETKYLETLYDPPTQQDAARFLALLPPTRTYPQGRIVASCIHGTIIVFDIAKRKYIQVFSVAELRKRDVAAKLTVSKQEIILGYDACVEVYQEPPGDNSWHLRAALTLDDTPITSGKARPAPTIDALAVLPNGCVVMLLATKLQIDNHMLVAMDLDAIIKGTVAKRITHQKILKDYGTTMNGFPFILLSNNKILLTLTETKILTLMEQKGVWGEHQLLIIPAPTAKLFEFLVLANSSMKDKDCIAVKKFTQHDTVFYKCYYGSQELPSLLLPDQQMAIVWQGKIMTFGLNEKALS